MILSIDQLTKSFGSALVLNKVTARVDNHDRIGFVGVNGAGKSTLLSILYGELPPDEGEIAYGSGKRMGFLKQDGGLNSGTIQSEMQSVFQQLYDMEFSMRMIETTMGEIPTDSDTYAKLSQEYSSLKTRFESADGYQIHVKISTVLNGMGFENIDRNTQVDVLSGGEKTRLALCKLLLESPDLLILDEPTNHLDFTTLQWLEEYLIGYPGALLVVSHDRYFLNKVCHTIWELQNQKLATYKGNYDKYLLLKEERESLLQRQFTEQREEIAKAEDFIARNIVRASTTKRAQSRRKALEKMDRIEAPLLPPKPPRISFSIKRESVKDVLVVKDLSLSVGEQDEHKQLFSGLEFSLLKGEKIAIVGPNGVGKSSFLKALVGQIKPDGGTIEWGRNTDVSYYDQGVGAMNVKKRAIDELWDAYPLETEHSIRSILGRAALTGEAVFKKVGVLSGGERARLKFAQFMMERGNVLLMDEPTNHLDLPTKEQLDDALSEYGGTLVVVSHDRYLLNKFPDKIAEFSENGMVFYDGRYDDYREAVEKKRQQESAAQALSAQQALQNRKDGEQSTGFRTKEERRLAVQRRTRLAFLEEEVPALEALILEISARMSLPSVASDYQKMQVEYDRQVETQKTLDELLEEWLTLS